MDLSLLAAKQKRAQDWAAFITNEVQSESVRARMSSALDQYRATLVRCWKNERVELSDQKALTDLERKLEELCEEGRMRIVGKEPLRKIPARF